MEANDQNVEPSVSVESAEDLIHAPAHRCSGSINTLVSGSLQISLLCCGQGRRLQGVTHLRTKAASARHRFNGIVTLSNSSGTRIAQRRTQLSSSFWLSP